MLSSARALSLEPPLPASPRAPREQVQTAFEILHYNQELVQFADGKANTLILINSIALASSLGIAVAIPPEYRGFAMVLRLAFLVACIASVGLSLAVVLSKLETPAQVRRRDLVFFGDILARPSSMAYRADFLRAEEGPFLDDLLERAYRVAAIASRKYRWYGAAQQATVSACALWMLYLVFVQMFV